MKLIAMVALVTLMLSGCASNRHHASGVELRASIKVEESERISSVAREQCGVENMVEKYLEKHADLSDTTIKMVEPTDAGHGLRLKIEIGGISGGGFSVSRLDVVSTIGFYAELREEGKVIARTSKTCSVGARIGFDYNACERLDEAADCVGAYANKWVNKFL